MSTGTATDSSRAVHVSWSRTRWVQQPLVWLDLARIVAALAIVWIHCPRSDAMLPTTILARFAVPFFVATSLFLVFCSVVNRPDRTIWDYAKSRVVRLYLPFLAWSGIYLAFKAAKWLVLPNQPNDFPGWEWLLVGGAYHLWFLPFLLIASLPTFWVARYVTRHPAAYWYVAVGGLLAGTGVAAVARSEWEPGRFEALYFMLTTVPAAFWAWPLALVYRRWAAGNPPGACATSSIAWSVFAASGIGCVISFVLLWKTGRNVWLENLAGVLLLVLVCVPLAPQWVPRAKYMASLSFGIYLGHLLFVKVIEAILNHGGIQPSPVSDVATWCGAVAAATLLTDVLQRRAATRWLT